MLRRLLILALPLAAVIGCAPDKGQGIKDKDTTYKVPAIKSAVEQKDNGSIPDLVAGLRNEDPAVRFYSIEGLKRLTGQTFGYRYYDDAHVRHSAVEKWDAWLADRQKQ